MTDTYTLDIVAANGVPFRVVLLPDGKCINYPAASDGKGRALVEFYDLRYPHTPDGQFVSRYYLATLLGLDEWSRRPQPRQGLCLDGGIPDWNVDGAAMDIVRAWLLVLMDRAGATIGQ